MKLRSDSRLLLVFSFLLFLAPACGQVDSKLTGGPMASEATTTRFEPTKVAPAEDTAADETVAAKHAELAAGVAKVAARAQLTHRREATVDCVWFSGRPGTPEAHGGTSPVTVRIEPNTKGEASVGVIEEYAGGAGDQWRAAAWMAAMSASETLGHLLTDHEFLVRSGGLLDGPSAGMLTTATMLAILTDTPVLENTTMSGTINPDGSAGPVGGLPQKMEGAKAKGKTRFGYPVGSRNSVDLETLKEVDLEVLGRDIGLEVKEIKDVRDAYQFLTGKELPTLEPADESDMAIESDLRQVVKAKVLSWKADLDSRVPGMNARLGKLKRGVQAVVHPIISEMVQYYEEAERFERSGLEMAAYGRYVTTAMMLRSANELIDVLEAMQRNDWVHVKNRISSLQAVTQKVKALEMELGVNARKQTLGGTVNSVAAFGYFNLAQTLVWLGDDHLHKAATIMKLIESKKIPRSRKVLAQWKENLLWPVHYYAAADAILQAGRESMDFAPEEGADLELDNKRLMNLAKAYGSAASAGVAYFDSTVVKANAENAGVSFEQAQSYYRAQDATYLIAPILSSIAAQAHRLLAEERGISREEAEAKPETAMIRLSAGVMSFMQGAALINKYYALGFSRDKDGTPVLTRRRALSSQLDLARRAALTAAGEAKRGVGFIPAVARLTFEQAAALREGDDEDKLDALSAYWQSAFWSRLVIILPRS